VSEHELPVLAHVDLSELLAAHAHDLGLPASGSLQLLWAFGMPARVLFQPGDGGSRRGRERQKPAGARHVRLSAELALPRAWTRQVAMFELSPVETEAWEQVRRQLATRQGVAASYDDIGGPGSFAVHRLLGYPDERLGQMPIACKAAARNIDLADQPHFEHPLASELEAASERWRLLFQLSLDERFAWDWGPWSEPAFMCGSTPTLCRAVISLESGLSRSSSVAAVLA
jgi:hypothetical protein